MSLLTHFKQYRQHAEKLNGESFTPRERIRQQHVTLDNGPQMEYLASKATLMMRGHTL